MDRDRMNRQGQAAAARRPRHLALATFAFLALALSAVLLATGADTGLEAGSASAATKKKLITGKLSKPGYTVIALASSGRAKTKRAPNGAFKLRPPADQVTLHLRASDGTYAGPIVVAGTWNLVKVAKKKLRRAETKLKKAKARADKASGKKATRKAKRKVSAARKKVKQARGGVKQARRRASGKEVVLGVKPGAELGAISVKVAAGYSKAKLKLRQWKRWVAEENRARAKKGVPIGAGNFGRVAVRKLNGKTSEGADRDLDGVPNTLDIDRDGDLVLDDVDAKIGGGGSATVAWSALGSFGIQQVLELGDTGPGTAPIVNANAPGLSDEQIESGLRNAGVILVDVEDAFASAELNCGELVYCSADGTGRTTRTSGIPDDQPFPECCDSDQDGFGSLQPDQPGAGGGTRIWLKTGAGADQIRGGDVLIAQSELRGSGEQVDLVHSLNNIFVTTSALASYTDELGVTRQVSYPYSSTTPLPVVDGPDAGSDVSATLHFWRPQRRPVPDELPDGAGNWIDIGGLDYWAIPNGGEFCPQSSYSESDPNLTPETITGQVPVLSDSALDQAASPANTFTYTLNISQCRAFGGEGPPFNPGATAGIIFRAQQDYQPDPERANKTPFNFSDYTFRNQP